MSAAESGGVSGGPEGMTVPQAAGESGMEQPQAWERIEDGRYMPRRIRGSCLGRELG